MATAVERFEAMVDRSGGPDACHPWTGSSGNGAPMFWANGRGLTARRFAWETANGRALPRKEFVAVSCGSRLCCNPAHLFLRSDIARRFWSFVRKGDADACWEWTGAQTRYGQFCPGPGDEMVQAHRYAWQLEHGAAPPADLCVCHRCDNPKCVRPDHLFLGTHADNMNDKVAKNRHARGAACVPGWVRRAQARKAQTPLLK